MYNNAKRKKKTNNSLYQSSSLEFTKNFSKILPYKYQIKLIIYKGVCLMLLYFQMCHYRLTAHRGQSDKCEWDLCVWGARGISLGKQLSRCEGDGPRARLGMAEKVCLSRGSRRCKRYTNFHFSRWSYLLKPCDRVNFGGWYIIKRPMDYYWSAS